MWPNRRQAASPRRGAWYEKSRELAIELKDQPVLGAAAQNIGIVCQEEGEAARERGDESRPAALRGARRSVEESLRIGQSRQNKPAEAESLSELAQIHLLLGDLAAADATPTKPARSTNPSASRTPGRTTTPFPKSPPPAARPLRQRSGSKRADASLAN